MRIMHDYAKRRTILEFEYFNEAGTGLGPTLEFYTLLSRQLQLRSLHMWRDEGPSHEEHPAASPHARVPRGRSRGNQRHGAATVAALVTTPALDHAEEYVVAPHGLFPLPLDPTDDSPARAKVLSYFRLLGRTVAKALAD